MNTPPQTPGSDHFPIPDEPPPPGDYEPGPPEDEPPFPAHAGDGGVVWEPPVPLSTNHELPAFPVDAFPTWLAAQVDAVAEATQTPPDLAGCVALAALSTAAGGRALARIRPGWDEPVNLYVVVALPPASRKSPVFRAMTLPLQEAEQQMIEQARPAIEQAKLEQRAAVAMQEKAEKHAHTAVDDQERTSALANALDSALAAFDIDIPPEPRLIADDITPEEAASLLAQQGGRLAILSAEGGIFATLAGRYSGAPNLDVFLKGHSCDLLRIDRRGRPSEWVKKPAVTVGLTVQPAIIDELSRTALFRGTGLLARFLYSLPENTIGSRKADPPAVPDDIAVAYDRHLRGLVHTLANWTDPAVLQFTPDANGVLIDLHNEIEPKMHPTRGEWAHIGDWAGKHVGHVGRIAALLHTAEHPEDPWQHPVTDDTTTRARRLGDYFAAHALAVFDRLAGGPVYDGAHILLAWIHRTGITRFTKRDAHRANRTAGRFQKVGDLDPALALLEEHGHIQLIDDPPRPGKGRKPSPRYLTHPQYHHDNPGQN